MAFVDSECVVSDLISITIVHTTESVFATDDQQDNNYCNNHYIRKLFAYE